MTEQRVAHDELKEARCRHAADTALLRDLEWHERSIQVGYEIRSAAYCPICDGMQPRHAAGCRLAARLREVEGC